MTMDRDILNNYISVSDAAAYFGKTTQHIYNMIKSNAIHAVQFKRGSMAGWLVEKPADYDNKNDK